MRAFLVRLSLRVVVDGILGGGSVDNGRGGRN